MLLLIVINVLTWGISHASEITNKDILPTAQEREVSNLMREYYSIKGLDMQAFLKLKDISLSGLKDKYKDHPEIATFLYAFKILNGMGGVKQSDAMACRFFLSLVPSMPEAGVVLADLCRIGRCDFDFIETSLSSSDPAQSNKNSIFFYESLLLDKKTPFELKEKIRAYFRNLEDVRPDLAFMRSYIVDPNKRFTIASRLAEKNYVPALVTLATSYHDGIQSPDFVLPKDEKKALMYFQKAADAGNSFALFNLGMVELDRDRSKAITYLKQAAAKNSVDAISQLGILALKGLNDDGSYGEPDYLKAFEWFNKSAQMGYMLSNFQLGFLYASGLGCSVNLAKSQEYYQRVLNSPDDPNAILKAQMYNYGAGVPEDPTIALKYYNIANDIFPGAYASKITDLKEKIREFSAAVKEDDVQIPIYRAPKAAVASGSSTKKSRNLEQEAHARLRSQEIDFQRKLNEKIPSSDDSEISKVDLTIGEIVVFRAEDGTQVIIKMPEDIHRRFSKGKRSFIYLDRVKKWFDQLNSRQSMQGAEYMSMIRHAFPQKVDTLARLFGAYTSDEKGQNTLALPGTLIPGKTKNAIEGSFVYGFQGDELYHRFMHQNKCILAV